MVKKLGSATLRLGQVRIVPLPGFHLLRMVPGEYLVVNDENSSNNVIVDAGTVLGLLLEGVDRAVPDEFRRGLGTMWEIRDIDD